MIVESDLIRYEQISKAFDDIKERYRSQLGQKDIDYIKGIRKKSRIFEFIGRSFIWFFREPSGVVAATTCAFRTFAGAAAGGTWTSAGSRMISTATTASSLFASSRPLGLRTPGTAPEQLVCSGASFFL